MPCRAIDADLPRFRFAPVAHAPGSSRDPAFLLLEVIVPPLARPLRGPKKTTRFAVIDYSVQPAERKLIDPEFGSITKKLSVINGWKSPPERSAPSILT